MARSILIVTNRAPWPLHDGGAMAMHQLILGYKEEGWRVHLLAMNTMRHRVEETTLAEAYNGLDSITIAPFDNRLRPARLLRNLLTSREPEHADRFYDVAFEQILLDTVQRIQPNAIQFESLFLTSYVPMLRRVSGARLILRLHNIEHQIWDRATAAAKGAKRLYLRNLVQRMKRFEQQAWNHYDLLLPITSDDAQAVVASGCKTPLHFTPYGINTAAQELAPFLAATNRPFRFYHLGAMDWLPNREAVAWFIREAWPRVRAVQQNAEFHFAGRKLEPGFGAPLLQGVFNHGAVEDAAAFIAGMDALVVPLRAGGGIRVKILEAMIAAKVVVATSIGIQGIDAVPGEHFFLANTTEEFATAVTRLVENPEEATRIANQAQMLVQDVYDAEKIMRGLSQCVVSLVASSE